MRAIRLSGGLDRCSGKLEVHRNGSWGTVCDNCWNERVASVVCATLGCGAAPEKISQFDPPLPHNAAAKWFYICGSTAQNLWQCREWEHNQNPYLCVLSKASGVICRGGWDTSPAIGPLMEFFFCTLKNKFKLYFLFLTPPPPNTLFLLS